MSSNTDNRNGAATYHSTALNMGPAMYNNGQAGLPWLYSGLGQTAQQKAAMTQLHMNGYGAMSGTGPNGMVPMALSSLITSGVPYYTLPDGRIIPSRLPPSAFQQQIRTDGGNHSAPTSGVPFSGIAHPTTSGIVGAQGLPWNLAAQTTRDGSLPDLVAPRRSSFSSNEENGPRTPFIGASNQADAQPKLVLGGSPHTWTTPSPHQLHGSPPYQIAKSPTGQYYFTDLTAICIQEPPIPKPIPAIFSGEKGRGTLEKSLQNNLNTTNVYIRGLHPNTTDEMLHSYGVRFGKIISAKSMLDQETGNCKGFGFVKYHNFTDGENCIRAFFHWGYEAKWARVSHNEKLKTLGDENNTNLYVSNLPLDFNEHSLMAVFDDFEVLSAKILRDTNGMSRGVGFARFSSPDICRKVIEQYNGTKIGEDGYLLSIRFADTPEQKKLKSVTAERRQYKASEYNAAAYSPGSPYTATVPTSYNTPLQVRPTATYWPNSVPAPVAPLYAGYTATPTPNLAYSASTKVAVTPGQENLDIGHRNQYRSNADSPAPAGLVKRVSTYASPAKSDVGAKLEQRYPLSGNVDAKSSPIKPSQYSPVKDSPSKAKAKGSLRRV